MEEIELPKKYLDGKVTLREPTPRDLMKVAPIILRASDPTYREYDIYDVTYGEKKLEIIEMVCDFEDNCSVDDLEMPLIEEIFDDFFNGWDPVKSASGNTETIKRYADSLPNSPQGSKTIKPPLEQE